MSLLLFLKFFVQTYGRYGGGAHVEEPGKFALFFTCEVSVAAWLSLIKQFNHYVLYYTYCLHHSAQHSLHENTPLPSMYKNLQFNHLEK